MLGFGSQNEANTDFYSNVERILFIDRCLKKVKTYLVNIITR